MAIERELPPGIEPALDAAAAGAGSGRADPLDIALVEHYLACTRRGDEQVRVDSLHLAQLCNEVWRRRREERDHAQQVGLGMERGSRLATTATKAIANVGHARPFEGHQHEATAIVQVANMLAELMQWRAGERVPPNLAARDLVPGGMTVRGSAEAMTHLSKLLAELESARQMIEELARMGWLMKAPGK